MTADVTDTIDPACTVADLLARSSLPLPERRLLLGHALGLSRVELITASERLVPPEQIRRVMQLFTRRGHGEPIAYLLGAREFYGLRLEVSAAVLIPRHETELLVELAIARLPRQGHLLDLGTGSGAIAVALAHSRRDASVVAVDMSLTALAVARRNAAMHAVQVELLQSDWFSAIKQRRFALIVANPPYIAAGDPHLAQGDLRFEPAEALTDHADGLAALRRIIADAPAFLENEGWLLLEHGYDQAAAVRALMASQGMHDIQSWTDLAGIERVTGARLMYALPAPG